MSQALPTQKQMILPLLEAMSEAGGATRIASVYDAVARKVDLPHEKRDATVEIRGNTYNAFERSVRWAQMQAKAQGLLRKAEDREWIVTGKGERALRAAKPGLVITIFTTDRGIGLYARCEDAIGLLEDGSVNLIMTSPPYPMLREKHYGNLDEREHVEWMLRLAEAWAPKLAADGSMILNMGDAWLKGEPSMSMYQERLVLQLHDRLGFKLSQRFSWNNPSKMPVPAEWVTIKRVRVKPSIENVWWLSQSSNPYADNRAVQVPYSEAMVRMIARGGQDAVLRPGGYDMADGAFARDNGGAIPGSLLDIPNTESNSHYIQACKRDGLPVHPARFPAALPEFFVKLCSRENDLILDPFAGSGTVGAVAERLNRRWVTVERILEYALGSVHRFPGRNQREMAW